MANRDSRQPGFTLVQAVFILVVLALLGVVMVRLIGVQTTTGVMALQGTRAFHAARSGLEWGAARASSADPASDPCDATICAGSFLIDGFNVIISCLCQRIDEGPPNGKYTVYRIEAKATYSLYGSPDYISRKVEMKVAFP
jgi:MSHA biogenesis protein MshP